MQVFVLTSQPLPEAPATVVTSEGGPAGMVDQLRNRGSDRDAHLDEAYRAFCQPWRPLP